MTTLRSQNGNCVAALQPAPGDLFVVTLLADEVALVRAAHEYGQVLDLAQAFADATPAPEGGPLTIKVLGVTLAQLLRLTGTSMEDLAADVQADEAGWLELAVQTCRDVLMTTNDAKVRADAYDLLSGIGGLS